MANPSIQLGTNSNWAIKEDKLLAYKEYNDYFFNKEFDFSRGTSATYVAKDGLIKTAGVQPNIVQNGDFSELGSELVTNGDFATDSDWGKYYAGDSNSITIANGVLSFNSNTNQNVFQTISSSNLNGFYKLTYTITSYTRGNAFFLLGGGSNIYLGSTVGTHTKYVQGGGSNADLIIYGGIFGQGGELSIDNVSVKEVGQNWTVANEDANNYVEFNQEEGTVRLKFLNTSPITTLSSATQYLSGKTYKLTVDVKEVVSGGIKVDAAGVNETFNSVGIQQRIIEPTGNATINFYRATANVDITLNSVSLQEIQTDTPRIDFTNDTKGHLLLEPQRTNLLPYSEDFTTYSDFDVSIESNTQETLSPQGIYNATKFTATGTDPYVYKSGINVTANTQTASIYVKGVGNSIGKEGRILFWYIGTAGGSSTSIPFTLTSDWQRVEGSSTPTSSGTLAIRVDLPNVAEVGDESYVYGFQMEEGSYATSYIPTTGAASTRNADICNNSGSAQDFNDTEGVLYAEIAALESTFSGSKFISISDGTYNNRASILFSTGATNKIRTFLRVGGVSQVDKSGNVTDVKDFNKVAFSYKENEFKMFINGSQVGSPDTSGSVWSPGTITKLSLTEINSALGAFNGKVRNVKVFTKAFTDAELQELTS